MIVISLIATIVFAVIFILLGDWLWIPFVVGLFIGSLIGAWRQIMRELVIITVNTEGVRANYYPPDRRRKSSGDFEEIVTKLLETGWELVNVAAPERGWILWVFQRERQSD
jgi:hypothetical protein